MPMPAPPILSQEAERLSALQDYGVLDTAPEAAFDDLVALAARICGTPISLVSLIDHDRQWFKAQHGLKLKEMPRAGSFCTHAIKQPGELLIVPDATRDPRFAGNPLVTGEPGIRFYAGVSLCTPEGHAVGTLCVIDRQPHTLTHDQQTALRVLGRQVMAQLELRRLTLNNDSRLNNSQRIARLGDWEDDFVNHRLSWSDELYRILGLVRENCPPVSAMFYSLVHPDDMEFVHRQKKIAAEGLRCVDFEHRIIRPDGEVRHIHQIAEMVYDEHGKAVRETGTLQDITERKLAAESLRESEERFKFVARAVSDVVWDWDLVAHTLWWNDGFQTTFGYTAGEIEPGVESWTSRIHPDERSRVVAGIHKAIDSGQATWAAEYRFRCKDGHYVCVQDRGYIHRDPAGKAVRMVGGMHDLTEQRNLETQLLRAHRMESIGTLAGGIAHDLNNVLAPIMMSIELLKLDPGNDPQRKKILDTIQTSSRRGADLVRQVLSFAQGLDGRRVAIRLRPLIEELKDVISQTFPSNIRIITEVPADLWSIMGDPTQLHQILLNLAVNARDAMPQGGTLTLAAANLPRDTRSNGRSPEAKTRPHVQLRVTDTGTGIPAEIRERIFEPFFTTKAAGKGTGLGLATVRTVVKSHGGFIEMESEPGRGTTFRIFLPADPALPDSASMPPMQIDLPRGHGELVLVVDDEFSIRHIATKTLEAFGYRVLTAGDGAEAVTTYSRHAKEIALVLTDMMMPVMDGATASQALRRINPDVKIIVTSGLDSGEKEARSGRSGVKHFLSKPYTAESLLLLVRQVIDRPALPDS